ncbi:hypothetical protein CPC08DRAFT_729418 [Agrocybe pediades]|nr:hypothetical protein CPC08DRAFT_729418 [Agrocybe pediades]
MACLTFCLSIWFITSALVCTLNLMSEPRFWALEKNTLAAKVELVRRTAKLRDPETLAHFRKTYVPSGGQKTGKGESNARCTEYGKDVAMSVCRGSHFSVSRMSCHRYVLGIGESLCANDTRVHTPKGVDIDEGAYGRMDPSVWELKIFWAAEVMSYERAEQRKGRKEGTREQEEDGKCVRVGYENEKSEIVNWPKSRKRGMVCDFEFVSEESKKENRVLVVVA